MFHSYVELPDQRILVLFWVCIPTILMLVFKVPKSVVCSTLNFWCIPIFACKLGSIPRRVSTRHYQLWDHWVECVYMFFQISGFHPLVSISHILWSNPVFALVGAHIWHLFVACFALRPPHDHVVKRCIWLGLRKLCHYAPAILRGAEDRRVFFSRGLVIAWHLVLSTTSLLDYAFDIPMSPLTCAGPARCGRNFTVEPEPTNNGKWKWLEIPLKYLEILNIKMRILSTLVFPLL